MKGKDNLEAADNWDHNRQEVREPGKPVRVVVSVAFQRKDFEAVSKQAKHLGKKTSEFIRDAALEKAKGQGPTSVVYDYGYTGQMEWVEMHQASTTRVYVQLNDLETHQAGVISA